MDIIPQMNSDGKASGSWWSPTVAQEKLKQSHPILEDNHPSESHLPLNLTRKGKEMQGTSLACFCCFEDTSPGLV